MSRDYWHWMEASGVRGAGNEARLERQRKVLGRPACAVRREGSLQLAAGEEGAPPLTRRGNGQIQLINVTRWASKEQKRHATHTLPLFQVLAQ